MKKLFVCCSLVLAIVNVQAAPAHLTPADDSRLSALCIAAASSARPLYQTALDYGINGHEISEVRCNGLPLDVFANKYKAVSTAVASKPLIFRKSDSSEMTELCFQALTSYDQYLQMLHNRTMRDASLQSELTCNGMPVLNFISRYRSSVAVGTPARQ